MGFKTSLLVGTFKVAAKVLDRAADGLEKRAKEAPPKTPPDPSDRMPGLTQRTANKAKSLPPRAAAKLDRASAYGTRVVTEVLAPAIAGALDRALLQRHPQSRLTSAFKFAQGQLPALANFLLDVNQFAEKWQKTLGHEAATRPPSHPSPSARPHSPATQQGTPAEAAHASTESEPEMSLEAEKAAEHARFDDEVAAFLQHQEDHRSSIDSDDDDAHLLQTLHSTGVLSPVVPAETTAAEGLEDKTEGLQEASVSSAVDQSSDQATVVGQASRARTSADFSSSCDDIDSLAERDRGPALKALGKSLEAQAARLTTAEMTEVSHRIAASLNRLPVDDNLAARATAPAASLVAANNLAIKHYVATIGPRFEDHAARRAANDARNEAAMDAINDLKAELSALAGLPEEERASQQEIVMDRAQPHMDQIRACNDASAALEAELGALQRARDRGVVLGLATALDGLTELMAKPGMQNQKTMRALMEQAFGQEANGPSVTWASMGISRWMRPSHVDSEDAIAVMAELARHAAGEHGLALISNQDDPAWGPYIANEEIKVTLAAHGVDDDTMPPELKALLGDVAKVPTRTQPGHAEFMSQFNQAEG